jgi:hypothetical protein
MGREVKRVPLKFDWPLHKPWQGYINPHYVKCATCGGSGITMSKMRLSELIDLLMLSSWDVLSRDRRNAHPYFDAPGLYHSAGKVCEDDMLELTTGLAGRKPSMLGHDAIDSWVATKKIVKAAGLPKTWGDCPVCKGSGVDPEHIQACRRWRAKAPPKGKGYQVWETVSEGSPISPVFATPEELAAYMAEHNQGSLKADYATWLKFITGPGWAPSMMYDPEHGLRDGVTAMVEDNLDGYH